MVSTASKLFTTNVRTPQRYTTDLNSWADPCQLFLKLNRWKKYLPKSIYNWILNNNNMIKVCIWNFSVDFFDKNYNLWSRGWVKSNGTNFLWFFVAANFYLIKIVRFCSKSQQFSINISSQTPESLSSIQHFFWS